MNSFLRFFLVVLALGLNSASNSNIFFFPLADLINMQNFLRRFFPRVIGFLLWILTASFLSFFPSNLYFLWFFSFFWMLVDHCSPQQGINWCIYCSITISCIVKKKKMEIKKKGWNLSCILRFLSTTADAARRNFNWCPAKRLLHGLAFHKNG